jgi:hypothetical protein
MRNGLKRLPTWALATVGGLLFGLVMAPARVVLNAIIDPGRSVTSSAITGFINGIFFGLVMIPLLVRRNRREAQRTGLEADELARAQRASAKGPVPDDPALLHAARDLCYDRVAMLQRWRVWMVSVQVIATLMTVAAALAWSLWLLTLTGAVAGLAAYTALLPRLARRRLAVLDAALVADKPEASGPSRTPTVQAGP